jgi:hypothetical protein
MNDEKTLILKFKTYYKNQKGGNYNHKTTFALG